MDYNNVLFLNHLDCIRCCSYFYRQRIIVSPYRLFDKHRGLLGRICFSAVTFRKRALDLTFLCLVRKCFKSSLRLFFRYSRCFLHRLFLFPRERKYFLRCQAALYVRLQGYCRHHAHTLPSVPKLCFLLLVPCSVDMVELLGREAAKIRIGDADVANGYPQQLKYF